MNYFINIGSNLGNRSLILSRAIRAIAARYGWFEVSHTVETEPWGFSSPHPFLNVCVTFVTKDEPEAVLDVLQGIERELGGGKPHRNADGSYADRALDIDIVAVDRDVVDTPRLRVPHPHLAERLFFLEPFDELAPAWRHPVTGLTPGEMIQQLKLKNKSEEN